MHHSLMLFTAETPSTSRSRLCDTVLDKERAQENAAHYCASSDKFEAEVSDLRQHVFKLEDEIKMAKKALEKAHGPSYCDVVQKSATKATCPPGNKHGTIPVPQALSEK